MTSSSWAALLLTAPPLLGARNLGAASRRVDQTGAGQMLVYLTIAVGVIAGVCLVLRLVSRLLSRRRKYSHASLFNALCRTHGLSGSARSLLKQLARRHKLAYPARVFTERQWLDSAKLRGREREIAALRQRLFG